CKEIYPSPKFVQMMFERAIPITFGSDAHAVEEVGKDLGLAVDLATRTGYKEYRTFTQRKMQTAPI
ncbi:MAG TPA: PHP-associated domain-containing protein, partial [Candidatus Saccharimonadales bacterium]|nr:PHP-associated domain-containing protein [Candidatus Saccharimonadales bacterium]